SMLDMAAVADASVDAIYATPYVALKKNFFEAEGLEVAYLNSQSGPRSKQMLAAQQLFVTTTGANDSVALTLSGKASVLVVPEITPGLWLYNKVAWAGVSMHQALGNRIRGIGTDSRLARQFMLGGGYKYRIARKTALVPSILLKKSKAAPWAVDLNAMVEWNRQFGLGAGYRAGDAVALMMKVSFAKFFQLCYAYDITTSRLRAGSSNTHEIVLGLTPCPPEDMSRRMINCPAFE
ncbi:MAG: PorP/SprF family type IX secretion system membrane protein, partial [Flavobacteriales bacterium]